MWEHRQRPIVAVLLGALALSALSFWLLRPSEAAPTAAAAASSTPKLSTLGTFSAPVFVTQPQSDTSRLFVVELAGRIRLIKNGRTQQRPFLDISNLVSCCGERGLLGLAFAPDYRTSGRFYVDYTDKAGDTRVVEYRRSRSSPDVADTGTARLVLAQHQPEPNHNGGMLAFGPDGHLYIGLGDGGGSNDQHGSLGNAQNLGSLHGKILRIDPRSSGNAAYSVPSDNPFAQTPGARAEIWSFGLRNPWRFSFDRSGGGLAIGDVGQNQVEEVDWAPAPNAGRGLNFGWRPWEGTRANFASEAAAGAVPPVAEYTHGANGCSVTGGYVIRDPRLTRLRGRYIYGDFCSGRIWTASLKTGSLAATNHGQLRFTFAALSSFGEDASGRIYLVSLRGRVARLDP